MYKYFLIFAVLQHGVVNYGLCFQVHSSAVAGAAEAAAGQAEQQVENPAQHAQDVPGSPSLAHAKLQLAEKKLLSSNSSLLDLAGGIRLLLDVADVLQHHMSGASSQYAQHQQSSRLRAGKVTDTQQQQQRSADGGKGSRVLSSSSSSNSRDSDSLLKRLGASSARSADRSKRRRSGHSRAAAVWMPLGRAGFMLAGLSASGLFTEFLPASPAPASSSNDVTASAAQQELSWLQTAALAGHVDSQLALADRHRFGRGGVEASCTRGLAWLKQAATSLAVKAEQDLDIDLLSPAVQLRDRWYDASYAATVVDEQAVSRALEADAVIHGDTYSLRRLGYRRLIGRGMAADPAEAFHDFVAAADGGDGYALYNLGYMSLKGIHTPRNPAKAVIYFRRALERGVAASANALGVMHFHGWGVPPSLQTAKNWFEQGANMSNPESFYNLGTMHLQGYGVLRDSFTALKYYSKAHNLGHWKSAYTMAMLYMKGRGSGGVGYDCDVATQHLWQFVAERSSWTTGATAALRLYDTRERAAALVLAHPDSKDSVTATPAASAANHAADASDAAASDAGDAAAAGGKHAGSPAVVLSPRLGPWWWPRWRGRFTQALLQYLLLAESGCGDCGVNAAWMLLRGEGAGGPRAVAAAADLLYRASLLNHTSSMIMLSQLLLEATRMPHTPSAAAQAQASMPLHAVFKLQQHFLHSADAFLPLVNGPTVVTGKVRATRPSILQKVPNCGEDPLPGVQYLEAPATLYGSGRLSEHRPLDKRGSTTTLGSTSGDGNGREGGSSAGGVDTAPAASAVLCRARRAAVAWLHESAQVGDTEAAANLAWMLQRGVVLQPDVDKASRLMDRARQHSEHTIGYPAVAAMQLAMRLEGIAYQLLGNRAASALVSMISSMHNSAVRLFGYGLDVVLAVPDGVHVPLVASEYNLSDDVAEFSAFIEETSRGFEGSGKGTFGGDRDNLRREAHTEHQSSSSRQSSGKRRGGDNATPDGTKSGMPVDLENLILTVLLGILAGVLWLRRRIHQ